MVLGWLALPSLQVSQWPMRLKFRRPLEDRDVAPLAKIPAIADDTLRLHTLKRRLMVVRRTRPTRPPLPSSSLPPCLQAARPPFCVC